MSGLISLAWHWPKFTFFERNFKFKIAAFILYQFSPDQATNITLCCAIHRRHQPGHKNQAAQPDLACQQQTMTQTLFLVRYFTSRLRTWQANTPQAI